MYNAGIEYQKWGNDVSCGKNRNVCLLLLGESPFVK